MHVHWLMKRGVKPLRYSSKVVSSWRQWPVNCFLKLQTEPIHLVLHRKIFPTHTNPQPHFKFCSNKTFFHTITACFFLIAVFVCVYLLYTFLLLQRFFFNWEISDRCFDNTHWQQILRHLKETIIVGHRYQS